jgi:hypothetical protein
MALYAFDGTWNSDRHGAERDRRNNPPTGVAPIDDAGREAGRF